MLFPSFPFVFAFLPIVLLVFYFVRRKEAWHLLVPTLLLASLVFYLLPNWQHGYIIISSIIFNFYISRPVQSHNPLYSRAALVIGIIFNLSVIGYFKYIFFFSQILHSVTGIDMVLTKVILPVGISFYTFQQIAYLVDCYKDKNTHYNFTEYALFIAFFPQLIAGPIVHHKELMPQISALKNKPFNADQFKVGIGFFIVGLAKKLILADNLAHLTNPVFESADSGVAIDTLSAWMASLSYTLQLYFDFSAYSDMAIGLGLMFGIQLPINFLSPYKSQSIIEFWRRWHITLSKFLRDYLYIALGGNRKGKARRYTNLMLTMLLGGLWHGAGWNFIIWGGLHGVYLIINHAFNAAAKYTNFVMPRVMGIALTLFGVVVAWVFFRAETTEGALLILNSMFAYSSADERTWYPIHFMFLAVSFFLVWRMPNTAEFFGYNGCESKLSWPPKALSIIPKHREIAIPVTLGILFALVIMYIPRPTIFIYFNF